MLSVHVDDTQPRMKVFRPSGENVAAMAPEIFSAVTVGVVVVVAFTTKT